MEAGYAILLSQLSNSNLGTIHRLERRHGSLFSVRQSTPQLDLYYESKNTVRYCVKRQKTIAAYPTFFEAPPKHLSGAIGALHPSQRLVVELKPVIGFSNTVPERGLGLPA